jgi:S1-C subfamily serine protease
VIGLRNDQRVMSQEARTGALEAASFPLSGTYAFRDSNIEVASLVDGPSDFDGVITDRQGYVLALWSSFAFDKGRELQQINLGVPADLVQELVAAVAKQSPLSSLEVEMQIVPLSSAREQGLSESWIKRLETHSPGRRQVLSVQRLVAGTPAANVLQPGDLLLAIDGVVVNRFREVERAVQGKARVVVTVLRGGIPADLQVDTVSLSGQDVDRIVIWSGATLQAPHRALAAQRGIRPQGVFVSYFVYGSPATRYGLWAGRRIVEVDGQPIPDLDAFVAAVRGRADRASVRLKTLSWNNSVDVITLKLDQHYWPSYEVVRTASGWERHPL